MTEEELREIEARANAATPGPWAWEAVGEKSNDWVLGGACDRDGNPYIGRVPEDEFVVEDICRKFYVAEYEGATCNYGDPDFISHARTDIPTLLTHIRVLQDELNELTWRMEGLEK